MSDHVDGPRQIGDPAADLTDLFAFNSPETAGNTVIAANVFPSAGETAMFSDVVEYALALRPASVAGMGDAAAFKTGEREYRFSCRFGPLEHSSGGAAAPAQRGTCTLHDGRELQLVANDEAGARTPEGDVRVFAGLRSDPFFLAWLPATLEKHANLLQNDNVLAIVIEFETGRVLDTASGSLFALIAETKPKPRGPSLIGREPPRLDWVGRPEQTNFRLTNAALGDTDDLRDLWNQQTPFAIAEAVRPIFYQRLVASLTNWDMRDGKADWTPTALEACAKVFLDDFILIDVAKGTSDTSYLEIERSTLAGKAYQSGGGRTVNSNVIDIMLTWSVNNDREFLQGGATGATKPGVDTFPYMATPNTALQSVVNSVELKAGADEVWALVGKFGGDWHPLIASIELIGDGIGQLRRIEVVDGKEIVERLEALDKPGRSYRYGLISGIPASTYQGSLEVTPKASGSTVTWKVDFLADGQPDIVVRTIAETLLKVGLGGLEKRFGAAE